MSECALEERGADQVTLKRNEMDSCDVQGLERPVSWVQVQNNFVASRSMNGSSSSTFGTGGAERFFRVIPNVLGACGSINDGAPSDPGQK